MVDQSLTSVASRLAQPEPAVGLLGGSLTAQTARLLADEADATGSISLSQATLAAMLGAQRSSVDKVLGELAEAGLIEVSYRQRVVDRGRLAQSVDPERSTTAGQRLDLEPGSDRRGVAAVADLQAGHLGGSLR